jgi:hypothetical protein
MWTKDGQETAVQPERQPAGPAGHGPCRGKARARPARGLRRPLDTFRKNRESHVEEVGESR